MCLVWGVHLPLKFVLPGSMEVGDFGGGLSLIAILLHLPGACSHGASHNYFCLGRQLLEQCIQLPFEGILGGSLFHPPL